MSFLSIIDCDICTTFPQIFVDDREKKDGAKLPAKVDCLRVIFERESKPHRYALQIEKLLRCDQCGTYYSYEHYDDDGESAGDTWIIDEITLKRFSIYQVIGYLQYIL